MVGASPVHRHSANRQSRGLNIGHLGQDTEHTTEKYQGSRRGTPGSVKRLEQQRCTDTSANISRQSRGLNTGHFGQDTVLPTEHTTEKYQGSRRGTPGSVKMVGATPVHRHLSQQTVKRFEHLTRRSKYCPAHRAYNEKISGFKANTGHFSQDAVLPTEHTTENIGVQGEGVVAVVVACLMFQQYASVS